MTVILFYPNLFLPGGRELRYFVAEGNFESIRGPGGAAPGGYAR